MSHCGLETHGLATSSLRAQIDTLLQGLCVELNKVVPGIVHAAILLPGGYTWYSSIRQAPAVILHIAWKSNCAIHLIV